MKDTDESLFDQEIAMLSAALHDNLGIKDRKYHLKTYSRCFLGTEAVKYLVSSGHAVDAADAVALGKVLQERGVFRHVTDAHDFQDADYFYRFAQDEEPFHGGPATKADGSILSWADGMLRPGALKDSAESLQASMPVFEDKGYVQSEKDVGVSPLDEHNIKMLDHVHPAAWKDPNPSGKYNLVVIGAGAGGLVTAAGAAGVGGKVAIIEEHLMGGDCLNVGCVPSKALIRCARAAHEARHGARFGVSVGDVSVDFGAVMQRMRRLRADISHVDSAQRFAETLGIDVFQGRGRFTSRNTIEVNGKTLTFACAVIASGGTAKVPPIPGLSEAGYLTNASFFNLTELPKRFAVIGAGPIGLELAQAMARFGAATTVFGRGGRVLEKEDPDAVQILLKQLTQDGVTFHLTSTVDRVMLGPSGEKRLHVTNDGRSEVLAFDALLVATGRSPNVEGMGLEAAGVSYDTHSGVQVSDTLQTSQKNIFAVGDCCTAYRFTHVADFMARTVIRNALFFGKGKMSSLLIPWCTFTEPEVAHVGLYPADLEAKGIKYGTYTRQLAEVDRAILDGATEGFVKIHVKEGGDKILGATIVAEAAGNMISEITIAMQAGMGLGSLAAVIHPYPTQAEAIRQAGDAFNRTRLTPFVKGLFKHLLALQRR